MTKRQVKGRRKRKGSLSYIYDQFLLIWWEKALLTNVDHCPVGVFLMVLHVLRPHKIIHKLVGQKLFFEKYFIWNMFKNTLPSYVKKIALGYICWYYFYCKLFSLHIFILSTNKIFDIFVSWSVWGARGNTRDVSVLYFIIIIMRYFLAQIGTYYYLF